MLDSKRSVVIITGLIVFVIIILHNIGASRGIGRNIAISVSSKVAPTSTIVIVARNLNGLEETKKAIKE